MKKKQINLVKVFSVILTLLYPFVIFFALQKGFSLRFMALFLCVVFVSNFLRSEIKSFVFLFCGLGFIVFLLLMDNFLFLKLYPVLMNLLFATFFIISLLDGHEPVVVKIAGKMGYDMRNCASFSYAKKATIAWSLFLTVNTIVSFITVFMSDTIWMVYNGFISYLLMGIMMLGEYIVRRRVLKNV